MFTEDEIKIFIILINDYQFDNCKYKIDGIDLTQLKEKCIILY